MNHADFMCSQRMFDECSDFMKRMSSLATVDEMAVLFVNLILMLLNISDCG